ALNNFLRCEKITVKIRYHRIAFVDARLQNAFIPRAGDRKGHAWILNIHKQPTIMETRTTGFRTNVISRADSPLSARVSNVNVDGIGFAQLHVVAAELKPIARLIQAHQTRNSTAIFTQQNAAARTYCHVVRHYRMRGVIAAFKYQREFFAARVVTENLPAGNSTAAGRGEIYETSVVAGAFKTSKTSRAFVITLGVVARINGLRRINHNPLNLPVGCIGITCTQIG